MFKESKSKLRNIMKILVWYGWDAGIIDNGKSIVFSKTFPDKKT